MSKTYHHKHNDGLPRIKRQAETIEPEIDDEPCYQIGKSVTIEESNESED